MFSRFINSATLVTLSVGRQQMGLGDITFSQVFIGFSFHRQMNFAGRSTDNNGQSLQAKGVKDLLNPIVILGKEFLPKTSCFIRHIRWINRLADWMIA
jgi:hypothetical protein